MNEDAPVQRKRCRTSMVALVIAMLSGFTSVLIGSFILLVVSTSVFTKQTTDMSIHLLVLFVYSGCVILPLSAFMAWPLMFYMNAKSNWIWLSTALTFGLVLTLLLGTIFQLQSFTKFGELLGIIEIYAAVFAITAVLLRKKAQSMRCCACRR